MRCGAFALIAAIALAAPASAQQSKAAHRWDAWLGCWQPIAQSYVQLPTGSFVCVRPTNVATTVEIATVRDGAIVARDTIEADGSRHTISVQGCPGWRAAEWSANDNRVYLHTEVACDPTLTRTSDGLMAFAPNGQWLDVRSAHASGQTGVHATRYIEVGAAYAQLPPELAKEIGDAILHANPARVAASGDVNASDVLDAAKHVDTLTVQTWLIERGQRFDLDAKQLVALAKAGVPGSVTDVMIGVSFPESFTLTARSLTATETQQAPPKPVAGADTSRVCTGTINPMLDPRYGVDPCAYPYGYLGYGYGYGYGYDPYGYSPYAYSPYYGYGSYGYYGPVYYGVGQVPTVVARVETPHGKAVAGRGYTHAIPQRDNSGAGADISPSVQSISRGSGPSRGSSASSGGSSSSSSSPPPRTAHVKPPPP